MADDDPLIGHQVGRFQVQEFLRVDKLGKVYLALELPQKRKVDLKVLDPAFAHDHEMFGRFGREMLATATINHPNSVQMLDFGDHRGLFHYLVLEHIDAVSVADELAEKRKLEWKRVVKIAHQVAGALKAAHDEKFIHRNLCPANLLLLQNAEGDFVKIADFGLARLVDPDDPNAPNLTAAGARVGQIEYMAPEYIGAGIVDKRGDLYALGICMYQMLVGEAPFTGRQVEVMEKQLSAPVPRVSKSVKVPAWLDDLVFRMMSKDLDARPADGAEVVAALEAGLGAPIELPAVTDAPVPKKDSAAPLAAAAVVVGVIVVGLVLVALLLILGLTFAG